jgi:hypothetical protein
MKYTTIKKGEINKITTHKKCPPREKAFFTMMRQSGLKPQAIKQLKIEDLERILEKDTPIPCKINTVKIKSGNPAAFVGNETVNYLKLYLEPNLKPENLLFHSHYDPDTPVNTKNISRTFKQLVNHLAKKGTIETSDLQLSSLTKFYKENAKHYTAELKKQAPIKDDEFYRRLYEEKAMPFLEIETPPPIETYRLKKQQQKEIEKRETEIRKIKDQLKVIEPLLDWVDAFKNSGQLEFFLDKVKNADAIRLPPDKGSFYKIDLPDEVSLKIEKIAEKTGKKRGEVLNEALETGIDQILNSDNTKYFSLGKKRH